ncbi:MAG: NUDIX domain-containing protein [Asticcacaulis sp.]
MVTIKQFGDLDPVLNYIPRTAGYGILPHDGRIACVRIGFEDFKYDLPGGAADGHETPAQAVVREFGEETGLVIEVVRPLADIKHYIIHEDGTPYNNHAHFFEVRQTGQNPALKCEADHELVWLHPLQVMTNLKNEGYAWPFTLWLRNQ